jgi:hypothetical protein
VETAAEERIENGVCAPSRRISIVLEVRREFVNACEKAYRIRRHAPSKVRLRRERDHTVSPRHGPEKCVAGSHEKRPMCAHPRHCQDHLMSAPCANDRRVPSVR